MPMLRSSPSSAAQRNSVSRNSISGGCRRNRAGRGTLADLLDERHQGLQVQRRLGCERRQGSLQRLVEVAVRVLPLFVGTDQDSGLLVDLDLGLSQAPEPAELDAGQADVGCWRGILRLCAHRRSLTRSNPLKWGAEIARRAKSVGSAWLAVQGRQLHRSVRE